MFDCVPPILSSVPAKAWVDSNVTDVNSAAAMAVNL